MASASRSVGARGNWGRRRRLPVWSVAGLAVVAGLALGYFVSYDSGEPSPSTVAAPGVRSAATLEGQVVALEAAVAARPDDATSWGLLGTAYVRRAAEVGDPAFYSLAERAFAKATELAPWDPTILVGRGVLALALHRFEEAEDLGQRATRALPANADALGVLVDAQVELGRYDDAADSLQAMLDVRPGLPALARTSYLRELNGDLDGAKQTMRRAIVAGTSSPFDLASVTALLGDLQRAGGDLDAALASYEEALRLSPTQIPAELGRAHVLAAKGDVGGALSVVEGVVERFPAPAALVLLAELQQVSGDAAGEAETIELVRLTATLQEEAGQVVDVEMAVFEADIGANSERAVALARRNYDVRPDNVFAADALAWALLSSGDAEAAVPFVEQAVRLGTANPLLNYHAAGVFAAVGDDERARQHLGEAMRAGMSFSVRHADAAAALAEELGLPVPTRR